MCSMALLLLMLMLTATVVGLRLDPAAIGCSLSLPVSLSLCHPHFVLDRDCVHRSPTVLRVAVPVPFLSVLAGRRSTQR